MHELKSLAILFSLLPALGCSDKEKSAPVAATEKIVTATESEPAKAKLNPKEALKGGSDPIVDKEIAGTTPTPSAGKPFVAEFEDGKKLDAPVGCLNNSYHDNGWWIMIGFDTAKPCDFDAADDFAVSFELSTEAKAPLPKLGDIFLTRIDLGLDENTLPYPATITVTRHESPFVVVSIEARDEGKVEDGHNVNGENLVKSFGGEMKIKFEEADFETP